MFAGQNIIVFDVETLRSAEDCLHCGQDVGRHGLGRACPGGVSVTATGWTFQPIGWREHPTALGLSIGCYFDYQDMTYHFFDQQCLCATLQAWVDRQAYLVSFNGVSFDGPLLCALVHDAVDVEPLPLTSLCEAFTCLLHHGYDILAQIWQTDPDRKFERGLNSLDTLSQANGYGAKPMDGAQAPRRWAQGHYAAVIEYCRGDVEKTRRLFEQIVTQGTLLRGDGLPLRLPPPSFPWASPQGVTP